MKRSFIITILLTFALPIMAQGTWGLRSSIGVEKKIAKGFDVGLEAKYHQTDNFQNTDRWSIGTTLNKRLYRNQAKTFNVKAGLGYKYMNVYNNWSTKYKDKVEGVDDGLLPAYYIQNNYDFNYYDSYVDTRHRVTASLQAAAEFGRFKVSWRESYQFTHTDSVSGCVQKYRNSNDADKMAAKGYNSVGTNYYKLVQGKSASDKSVLRSKISLDYDIPKWKYDPFISYEMFNGIDNGFQIQKSRITAGIEFSFNKKHNFELAYLWQNQHDEDEPAGSFICIGYTFEL